MSNFPPQIGRYQVLGILGTGGMAEVLLARVVGPSGFQRPVVIKRILPHLARAEHFRNMFLDEARIVAGISHQNVVHVHELCQDDGELFMVMEYLEGESAAGLARRLSSKRKLLSFGLAAHIVAEAADGLHAAHNLRDPSGRFQNLVHRDVSPANIFVSYDGGVKILDFGIAVAADRVARTEAGQVKGKYAYMSPEQCRGKALDRRSDIFSLGTVLYEISTCRRLFKRDSDMLTLQAICAEAVVPPSELVANYPAALEAVVMKALAKDKADRYQSALEMRRELLEVSRLLNEGKVPEESLGRVMHKLFEERIEQKHALLSRIESGSEVTAVPLAEADSSVELPAVAFAEDPRSESAVSIPSGQLVRPRNRRVALVAAAVLLLGLGIAGGLAMTGQDAEAEAPATPAAAVEPAAPAEPQTVAVNVDSRPAGARVFMAGEPKGETPLRLEVARGAVPIEVTLELDGYTKVLERVVPDMDQKIQLVLVRAPPKVAAESPRPASRVARPPPPPVRRPPPAAPEEPKPKPEEDPYKRFN
ncbi:MAG: serine/threonine protein kinase [Myxococcales bacterium]|nr:serine/threonine protein kinase [Myxococcales bacterium]